MNQFKMDGDKICLYTYLLSISLEALFLFLSKEGLSVHLVSLCSVGYFLYVFRHGYFITKSDSFSFLHLHICNRRFCFIKGYSYVKLKPPL